MINVPWSDIKGFAIDRSLPLQWVVVNNYYHIYAFDGPFYLTCQIPLDGSQSDNQADFEANFKPVGNKCPKLSVTTEFEKNDKTLKLASAEASVDLTGDSTILLKVPGVSNSGDGRYVDEGIVFFDITDPRDVIKCHVVDHDNKLGMGVDFVVGSYTDDEMPAAQQGWRIPPKVGYVSVSTLGFYGFVPSGMYLRVVGKRQILTGGSMFCNIKWGKKE